MYAPEEAVDSTADDGETKTARFGAMGFVFSIIPLIVYGIVKRGGMNFALIMGAEHAGVSKSLLKLSDFIVKIPMLTNFNSLNVSNAAAIILFESTRQLLNKQKAANSKKR